MDLRGKKFGHIRIVGFLGEGGVGKVWEGYDEKLERKVALKAIHHTDPDLKTRLLREARILSQLDHPKICRVYEFLEAEETDFLVLELVEGKNLREWIHERPDDSRKLDVARQLAEVLVEAHSHAVIHRDLKPENVMITSEGEVKVLDFGLARYLGEELSTLTVSHDLSSGAELDGRPFYLRGTAAYMSPEQAQGEAVTEASDMFAFGVTLQELFTGRLPYEAGLGPPQLLLKVAQAATLPMKSDDAELDALIERLKSLSPARRPTAVDTAAGLRRIRERPQRKRRTALLGAVMGVLIAAVFGMAFLAHRIALEADRANRESDRANREASTAYRASEILVDVLGALNNGGTGPSPQEILEDETRRIGTELGDEPLARARLMDTLGRAYMKLDLDREAELRLREALAIRQNELGHEHLEVAESLEHLGHLFLRQRYFEDAEKLFENSLAIRLKKLGPDHRAVAESRRNLERLAQARQWLGGEPAKNLGLLKRP